MGGIFDGDSAAPVAADDAGACALVTMLGIFAGAALSRDVGAAALASAAATLPPPLSVSLMNLKRAMHCPAVLLPTSVAISRHRFLGSKDEGWVTNAASRRRCSSVLHSVAVDPDASEETAAVAEALSKGPNVATLSLIFLPDDDAADAAAFLYRFQNSRSSHCTMRLNARGGRAVA